jgi:hypothetical protein
VPDSPRYALDERLRITDNGEPLSLPDVLERLNAPVDLVGKKEAAAIIGMHPNNIGRLPGLPAPEWTLSATPAWQRSTIEAFAASRNAPARVEG